jgi:hypothetical protein
MYHHSRAEEKATRRTKTQLTNNNKIAQYSVELKTTEVDTATSVM